MQLANPLQLVKILPSEYRDLGLGHGSLQGCMSCAGERDISYVALHWETVIQSALAICAVCGDPLALLGIRHMAVQASHPAG